MVASAMTSPGPRASPTDDHIHEFPATSCPKHKGPWRAAELKSYVGMPGQQSRLERHSGPRNLIDAATLHPQRTHICRTSKIIKLKAWCRAPERFHDSNRLPGELPTGLVLHLRWTSHAWTSYKLFLVTDMTSSLPQPPPNCAAHVPAPFWSSAASLAEDDGSTTSCKSTGRSLTVTYIHTGSSKMSRASGDTPHSPRGRSPSPKHALTRCCHCNTA